jgi:hypothetical protein
MDDTTIIGDSAARGAVVAGRIGPWSGITWSAVIAGAITAIAVSIIIIALGSGIGMVLVSPYSYSSPSAGTMTVIGALWLVFAQAVGFATGGYVAGRLRRPPAVLRDDEVKFRDGANGLVVWAIGVLVISILFASAVGKIGAVASSAAEGTAMAGAAGAAAGQSPSLPYFTDMLLRPNPQNAANGNAAGGGAAANTASGAGAPNGSNATAQNGGNNNASNNNTGNNGQRAQVTRILVTSFGPNGLSNDDRAYLAQMVSAQTGLSQDDAQRRVDDVTNRIKQDATQAAETARKAAAYLSFWTFMSLLFGAVCATLGGMLGGDLRDEFASRRATATARA